MGMISSRIAIVIAVGAFVAGSFFASPVPAAIAAVIATDVQCTGCVGTSDLAGNAVTAAKIKDNEVKAPEIATDAVGAAEIIGVTKMLFVQCAADSFVGTLTLAPESGAEVICKISGVDPDDSAFAQQNSGSSCFGVRKVHTDTDLVSVAIWNECTANAQVGTGAEFTVLVYDK